MDFRAFEKKWDNYWYHYKWQTWFAIFLIFCFGWFIRDVLSHEKYDLNVVCVTEDLITLEDQEILRDRLEKFVPDYDGNGESKVDFICFSIPTAITSQELKDQQLAGTTRFQIAMADPDKFLYIFDDTIYENFGVKEVATDIGAYNPAWTKEDPVKLSLDEAGVVGDIPTMHDRGLFMTLRSTHGLMHGSDKKQAEVQENYNRAEEVLKNFMTGHPVAANKE